MIGIYKITKKENGKSYIGQSNNIERRFAEHRTKGESSRIPLDIAIQKYNIAVFVDGEFWHGQALLQSYFSCYIQCRGWASGPAHSLSQNGKSRSLQNHPGS